MSYRPSHLPVTAALLALAACGGQPTAPAAAVPAAPPPGPAAPPPATGDCAHATKLAKPVTALAGEWRGEGWIEMRPGAREHFAQIETVRCALGSDVLVIEGLGRAISEREDDADGPVVHQALGLISVDPAGKHTMRAYSAGWPPVDSPVGVAPDGQLTWGMTHGPVEIRFRIHLSPGGQWIERGEMSHQGSPWRQFFEMKLTRQSTRT
jgi:hypothetical protein